VKWQVQTANMEVTWLLAFIVLFNSAVNADYPCICNYNVEKEVLGEVSQTGSPIGYLYEFDCKPEGPDTGNAGWLSIQFENQYGYLHKDSQTEKQTCPGNPSAGDIVFDHLDLNKYNPTVNDNNTNAPISINNFKNNCINVYSYYYYYDNDADNNNDTDDNADDNKKANHYSPSNKNTIDDNFYHNKNNTVVTENCDINGHQCNSNTNVVSLRSNHHHAVGSFVSSTLFTVNGHCYEAVTAIHSWRVAESYCVNNGGHLAYISSKGQQDAIYQVVKEHIGQNVWIGLNDLDNEGSYRWISDSVAVSTLAPTTTTTTSPVTTILATTASATVTYGCTTVYPHYGYTEAGTLFTINNTCYELNANLHTWRTANSMCNSKGGSLAYIDNRLVQDAMYNVLKSNLNQNVWIGLNDLQYEGYFSWVSGEKLSYTLWHNGFVGYNDGEDCVVMMASTPEGESVNYLHWIRGHVDNIVGRYDEDCVVMFPQRGGHWDDVPCGWQNGMVVKHVGICEYRIQTSGSIIGK
ncbi:MRC2-like protein, partial [Mya arenaria]